MLLVTFVTDHWRSGGFSLCHLFQSLKISFETMLDFFQKIIGGADEAATRALKSGAVVIDVRTKAEFDHGNVRGSLLIPLDQIGQNINKIKKYNKPIVLCCATGRRSGIAAGILRQHGIEAYNGGGWATVKKTLDSKV
jgi:rhodanese-related sulfurtransferase